MLKDDGETVRFYKMSGNLKNSSSYVWVKVFKNGPSKICGKQSKKFEIILLSILSYSQHISTAVLLFFLVS